jgi:diguanylate cyclase (GGDEF)-like protein
MLQHSKQLQKQGLIDLIHRAKGGIAIHLAIWFVLTLSDQLLTRFPSFFYINSVIFLCIVGSRTWHFSYLNRHPEADISKMYHWFVGNILFGGLHWGIMCAIILFHWDDSSARYIWIVVTFAVAIGGSLVLSISNAIRVYYSIALIMPSVCTMVLYGGYEQWVIAAFAILALLYIQATAKVINADYWSGIKNRFLAEKRAEEMHQLSHTDQLTQLNNRMFFDGRFAEEWELSSRMTSPLSILMLDLDNFKIINDSHGHVFGDECLRRVAQTLLATIQRETYSVARYGGEEFVILLPDTCQHDSETIAARVLLAISEIGMSDDGQPISLTCSIGIATAYAELDQNREALLKSADVALYQAKNKGRNRIQVSSTSNNSTNNNSTIYG